jgi:hypothetical protein
MPITRPDIAERFARDTANHQMTVLHDDGLYRHLRFRAEGSMYWFDLITVPGSLIFRGDGQSFVFARLTDMFEFFRGPLGRINPGYWAEKLTSCRDEGVRKYDREVFEQVLTRELAAVLEAHQFDEDLRGLGRAVREQLLDSDDVDTEESARRALEEFEYRGFRFADTWEWNFRDYDWWFLWACHAIVWGIAYYDTGARPDTDASTVLRAGPAVPHRRRYVPTTTAQPAGDVL